MDIDYKILWFEDTDESFETLSRRTKRYIEGHNLRCQIYRVWGASDFDISKVDLNNYEMIVVDLVLSDNSRGVEVIQAIRSGSYVNDVLFYSAEGIGILDGIMKEHRLEGVFLSERNHKQFIPKMEQLIQKSIRRSENVINIRGIVMDETSEFDTQMCEIINAAQVFLSQNEVSELKTYISSNLLNKKADEISTLARNYSGSNQAWHISDVLAENEFNSMMKAKLLNRILSLDGHTRIKKAVDCGKDLLPQAFNEGKVKFVAAYDHDILAFRNKLAHVKHLNAETPVYIGKINNMDYHCDSAFCAMLRSALIDYGNWFDAIYESISKA